MAGAIRYYDGQVDDARFVVTLARTAASLGAAVVTGVRAVGLVREAREVTGMVVRDGEDEFDGPGQDGHRRDRGVEQRRVVVAARRPGGVAGAGLQGRAPGGAPFGDHRRGRADPAYRPNRCCSSSRGAGTGSSAPPTPSGRSTVRIRRLRPRTSTICWIRSTRCWSARSPPPTSRVSTPGCARCCPARRKPPRRCRASTPWSSRCSGCCSWRAASSPPTG